MTDSPRIIRAPHDRANPHVVITNSVARGDLSLRAKGMLLFLLSLPDDWQVNTAHVAASCKISPKQCRDIFNELIEAGHMRRMKMVSSEGRGRLSTSFYYEISENPSCAVETKDLKECFRNDRLRDVDHRRVDTCPLLSNEVIPSNQEEPSNSLSFEASDEASSSEERELANYLLSSIRAHKPDFRQPDMKKWATEMRRLREIDKVTGQRIRACIDFAQADSFWRANILSPQKLRKQIDALELKISAATADREKASRLERSQANLKFAMDARTAGYPVNIYRNFVAHKENGKDLPLDMDHDAFCDAFMAVFRA